MNKSLKVNAGPIWLHNPYLNEAISSQGITWKQSFEQLKSLYLDPLKIVH